MIIHQKVSSSRILGLVCFSVRDSATRTGMFTRLYADTDTNNPDPDNVPEDKWEFVIIALQNKAKRNVLNEPKCAHSLISS